MISLYLLSVLSIIAIDCSNLAIVKKQYCKLTNLLYNIDAVVDYNNMFWLCAIFFILCDTGINIFVNNSKTFMNISTTNSKLINGADSKNPMF